MRIAYLLADHGIPVFGAKGASVHVRELAGALARRGHEVTVFCLRRGLGEAPVPFAVEEVTAPALSPGASREDKERHYAALAERLRAAFERHHARRPFDVVYERYALWSAAGVRAAKRLGLPVLVEVNAPLRIEQARYRQLASSELAEALEREVFAGADGLLVVSRQLADYVRRQGAAAERIEVIPNGVDVQRFSPDVPPAPLPEAEGRFVVGFAGSLKAWHGIEVLMRAFRELAARVSGVHLLVAGDGPLRQWVEGFVAGADLEDLVTLTGWVDHWRLPSVLARADVAVAPYPPLEDFYFSPLKLFEYLALGKPVVASAIGQIAEVLDDGRNGLLVPPGDVQALADALERLAVDEALARRLSRAAVETAAAHAWERIAQRVEALMERACAEGGR